MKLSNETKIALFAIAAIAVAIWGFKFLKGINILTTSRVFYVRYDNVDQLLTSSPVFINGLQVGMVKNLAVDKEDDKTIVATLNIDADVDIHKDAVAVIRSASLMGGKAVEIISPAPCEGESCAQSGDYLKGGSKTFLQTMVGDPKEIDLYTERLLRGVTAIYDSIADPNDPQGLGRSLVALEKSLINLEGMTFRLNRVLDASSAGFAATANNTADITKTIRESSKDITAALANLNALSEQLKNAGLDKTTQKATSVLDSVALSLRSLRNTLGTTQMTLTRVDTLASNLVRGKGLVGKALTEEEMYDNFVRTSRQLHLLLQDLRINPKRYTTVKLKLFGKNKTKGYTNPLEDPAYEMLVDSLERSYSKKIKQ